MLMFLYLDCTTNERGIFILLFLIKIDSQFLYQVKAPKKGFCLVCNSLYFWAHQHVDLDHCL